ncbi:Dipeptidyl peptidase 8 [Porphyridium purpureum]|uniref:Dipeptidyl peptidase 8 n=1 Tax=Porphyridium purpureum TaxID=35688 RepID=A0A5J4YMR2_PORPP|nr:Dipeptidyl peptidase 8 [Porphyridium purpureum]|eukprot:POR4731..scf244_11
MAHVPQVSAEQLKELVNLRLKSPFAYLPHDFVFHRESQSLVFLAAERPSSDDASREHKRRANTLLYCVDLSSLENRRKQPALGQTGLEGSEAPALLDAWGLILSEGTGVSSTSLSTGTYVWDFHDSNASNSAGANSVVVPNPVPAPTPTPIRAPVQELASSAHFDPNSNSNGAEQDKLTKEEELLRERLRMNSVGLTTFKLNPKTGKVLFAWKGTLHSIRLAREKADGLLAPQVPIPISQKSVEPRLDAKWSADGRVVAFVRDSELWILDSHSGKERQITRKDVEQDGQKSNRKTANGVAEYIMQEEFDRYTGYWWYPEAVWDMQERCVVYTIAYMHVDESGVPVVRIPRSTMDGSLDDYSYPRVGEPNAVVEPRVVRFKIPAESSALGAAEAQMNHSWIDELDLFETWAPQTPIREQFAWAEYIVHAGWLPADAVGTPATSGFEAPIGARESEGLVMDTSSSPGSIARPLAAEDGVSNQILDVSSHGNDHDEHLQPEQQKQQHHLTAHDRWLWLLLLDRVQQRSALVACKDGSDGRCVVLYEERSKPDQWINMRDCFHFAPVDVSHARGASYIMLFLSERSDGFSHLHLKVFPLTQDSQAALDCHSQSPEEEIPGSIIRVTSGNWTVEQVIGVDWKNNRVFFTGTRDSYLELHVYCTPIFAEAVPRSATDGDSSESSVRIVQRITTAGHAHTNCTLSADQRYLVVNQSSLTQPPRTLLYGLQLLSGKESALVHVSNMAQLPAPDAPAFSWGAPRAPELFHFRSSDGTGTELTGCLYHPNPSRAGRVPTLLHVYGGPHVQLVSNDYRLTVQAKFQLLSQRLGVAVVMIDGRGSARRGLEFEARLYGNMGDVELSDQVDGLQFLVSRGVVDPQRIAVSGWSYGGYMSLMALMKRPDVFKCAVSGAPVVRWELYDTGYTERYMNLPRANVAGYSSASILSHVAGLPEDPNERLMIVHSLMDENVHVVHTSTLLDAMIRLNKPYRLLLFPNERHGLRAPSAQVHFESNFFRFVLAHLFGKG